MISSRSFTVSGFTFKSSIHFEFFLYIMRKYSNLIVLQVAIQFSQHHLLKRLSFLHCIFLSPLSQINSTYTCGFTSRFSVLLHCLVSCHYHAILNIIALQYSLKSSSIPPALFFPSQDCFGSSRPFMVLYKFQDYLFQFSKNICLGSFIQIAQVLT